MQPKVEIAVMTSFMIQTGKKTTDGSKEISAKNFGLLKCNIELDNFTCY